jgi:hypothetical protein
MCTLSIVPHDDGFRLSCNRDERRARPPALAPSLQRLKRRAATFPVDPLSGGTWIGVNEAGLTMALLNRTIDPAASMRTPPLRSRGLIVPALLGCGCLAEALEMAASLNPADFDLFRLVVVQHTSAAVVTSGGFALSVDTMEVSRPLMLTSSSLGDAVVEGPRRRLFQELVMDDGGAGWISAQSHFHHHQWPESTHISVSMERSDALTVSRTVIDVSARGIELRYQPVACPAQLLIRAA